METSEGNNLQHCTALSSEIFVIVGLFVISSFDGVNFHALENLGVKA